MTLTEGLENFVVYFYASYQSLGCVLMQNDKVIAYASRQLKPHEKNHTSHESLQRILDHGLYDSSHVA